MLGDDFADPIATLTEILLKCSPLVFLFLFTDSVHIGGFLSKTSWILIC